ncbi:MAG: AsmA family protein, partial [Chromatiaceae bacterium]
MKALKLLLVFSLVAVVLLGGLLVALSLVDIDHYKGQIESQVSRVLGREFVIEGDSELRVSLTPGLILRGVRLQNADWGSRADMLYAEEAEIELAILPLLSGHFDIKKLILLEPDVLLETNEAGRGNWEFGESVEEPAAVAEPADAEEPVSIALTLVNVKQGRFRFNDGVTQRAHDLSIENLEVKASGDDQLDWNLASSLDNVAVTLNGRSDSLETLLRDRPWAGRFKGNLDNIKFSLEQSVERPLAWIGLNLKAQIEAPDLDALSKLTARELPPFGPLEIAGKVTSAGALYNVEVSAVAGDAKLALAGSLAQSLDGKGLNLDVTAETPRTKSLTDLAGAELPELGPVAIAGKLTEAGESLKLVMNAKAGDIQIDVDGQLASTLQTQGMGGQLKVTAPSLDAFSALAGTELPSMAPVDLQGSLSDAGQFFKVRLSGTLGKVEVNADTQVAHSFELKGLGGNLSVEAPNLTDFSALTDTELPSLAPVKLEGSLSDLGKSFELDLRGEAGEFSVSAKGQIAESLDGKGVDVDLFAKAPDLALVGDLAGTALPPVGPVEVKAKLIDVSDGHKLEALAARVGKSDLSGSAEIGHQAKPMRILADLNSKLLDLVPFEAAEGSGQAAPAEGADATQEAEGKQAERVFSP